MTNVYGVGPAPSYGNDWAVGSNAINQGLQSVLGYYSMQQQRREQAKQDAMRQQQFDLEQARQQDAMDRQHMLDAEADALNTDPTQAPMGPAPTPQALAAAQPSGEAMGAMPDTGAAAAPVAPLPTAKPVTEKQYGAYTAHLDYGGKAAAERQRQKDIAEGKLIQVTPEMRQLLGETGGLLGGSEYVSSPVVQLAVTHMQNQAAATRAERMAAERERADRAREAAADKRNEIMMARIAGAQGGGILAGGPAAQIFPDLSGPELLEAVRSRNPQAAATLEGIVSGNSDITKVTSQRSGERSLYDGLARRIDPEYDPTVQPARANLQKDMTTGKMGVQIGGINTALQHLDQLKKHAEELDADRLMSRFTSVNAFTNWVRKQTNDPKLAGLKQTMLSTATEMAKALKGNASPSTEEINEELKVMNESANAEGWDAVIRARIGLLAGQANSIRERALRLYPNRTYFGVIGPSAQKALTDMGHIDLVDPSNFGDEDPKVLAAKKKAAEPAAAVDPYTAFKSGQTPTGATSKNPFDMH